MIIAIIITAFILVCDLLMYFTLFCLKEAEREYQLQQQYYQHQYHHQYQYKETAHTTQGFGVAAETDCS